MEGYPPSPPLELHSMLQKNQIHGLSVGEDTKTLNMYDTIISDSFWQVESTGTTQVAKTLDSDFLQDYLSTKITVQSDGAYSLKFPWKDTHPPLELHSMLQKNQIHGPSVGEDTKL